MDKECFRLMQQCPLCHSQRNASFPDDGWFLLAPLRRAILLPWLDILAATRQLDSDV